MLNPSAVALLAMAVDAMMFRNTRRRFIVRPMWPGEFAEAEGEEPLLLLGDGAGGIAMANAVIVDRKHSAQRIACFIAPGQRMPRTDKQALAFLRKMGAEA